MRPRAPQCYASRFVAMGLVALLTAYAAGCASGTLGKVSGSDELPKEISPDLKQKFEVMEQSAQPQPIPQVSGTPGAVLAAGDASQGGEKPSAHSKKKKKRKHGHKKSKQASDEVVAAPSPTPAPLEYPSRRPAKEPIWVGEKLSFDVSYFGVSAGEFKLEALPHKMIAGREVYHIRGNAVTSKVFNLFYRLNDMVETFIDFQGVFSHRFHIVLDETKQARDALELYDAEKAQTFYWNRWNHKERGYTETKEFDPAPRFAQDSLSVLYYLRTVPLPDGAVVTVPVVSEGKNWEAVVTVLRRETMRTPMGKVSTIVVKPETRYQGILKKQGDSFLWLTDDDRRVPVRLEAKVKVGTVVANLNFFEPGKSPDQVAAEHVIPASFPSQIPSQIPTGANP